MDEMRSIDTVLYSNDRVTQKIFPETLYPAQSDLTGTFSTL